MFNFHIDKETLYRESITFHTYRRLHLISRQAAWHINTNTIDLRYGGLKTSWLDFFWKGELANGPIYPQWWSGVEATGRELPTIDDPGMNSHR
jgi:hypothetical protein